MGSNLGTLDLKASTLSILPLALLKNGTLSALPYDSNFECLKFYKSQNSKLTAKRYHSNFECLKCYKSQNSKLAAKRYHSNFECLKC